MVYINLIAKLSITVVMQFKPFEKKLVAVLNKNLEPGRIMNALAHMSLGLGASVSNREELRLQDYIDASNHIHPQISDIPFIVLRATTNQIRTLRQAAQQANFSYTDFTNTMIGKTYVDQHQATNNTKEEDLEYFGICIFGNWQELSTITKKFSLWR